MATTPADLPDSIGALRALVLLQQEQHEVEISDRDEEIIQLREYIRLLRSQRFGPSSERTVPDQMGLFNEAETLCDGASGAEEASIEVPAHARRKRGGRRPLPAFLPREEILHDLPEDQKVCRNDPSHSLAEIGQEKLEQLVFIPATAKVLVHLRSKYACPKCKDGIKTAPMPPQPIPKSMATP